MKTKSSYHKSENTFRFLTFSERLSNVNIDIIHRIDRTGGYAEEVETYFYEGLQKWRDLNLTEQFVQFYREVVNKCQSFNQLVYYQSSIVHSLKTHLQVKGSLACQPLLDLVVQLARDLQTDFYPHFREFFLIITALLDSQDTELLEWAFTSLSYLYKYLWRLMVKDIADIYSLYSTLLAHNKSHIRNFAAESFAFLMRKVPDQNALFNFMFLDLEEHPEKAEGVGQLLFEMCKGVRHMFHSCAVKALPIILQKLGPITETEVLLPWVSVGQALKHMVTSAASYLHKENIDVLWNCLRNSLLSLYEKLNKDNSSECSEQIERLLQIYLLLTEYAQGSKLTKPEEICETLTKIVQASGLSVLCCKTLLEVISTLLLDENVSVQDSLTEEIVRKVFKSGFGRNLILNFSEVMFNMKQFEQNFLPSFLQYIEQCFGTEDTLASEEALAVLAKLILVKAEPPSIGSMAFEKYPLLFTGQSRILNFQKMKDQKSMQMSVLDHILSLIELPKEEDICDLSHPWAALVVIPHIRPMEAEKFLPWVTSLTHRLLTAIESGKLYKGGLFVARQAISSLLSLKESSEILELVPVERVRNLLTIFPADPSSLLLADLYYTRLVLCGHKELLSQEALMELFDRLRPNLSTNISKVRLLTLRILNHFEVQLPEREEDDGAVEIQSVFATSLHAELVPATVHDYREKLIHLRKLRHDLMQPSIPSNVFQEVPLRYLLGMLYINFSHLWDPVIELLISHATGMENKAFWKVYYEHLEKVAVLAEKELQDGIEEGNSDAEQDVLKVQGRDVAVLYLEQLEFTVSISDRTDFTNFRFLLWKAMTEFPNRVESRSRELSPLLLRFINNEYYPADLLVAPSQDLRKKKGSNMGEEGRTEEMGVDDDAAQTEEEVNVELLEEAKQVRKNKPRRAATKQLIIHLKVFSKFTNPRSLYLEPKLKELYSQLLCHQDQEVQKVALECIMTYNHPHLLPYKESLQRLLEDKNFKEEIVHFNISEESSIVKAEHRPDLIPVLMRILYGRMRNKTGSKSQGKSGARARMAIVLQFLAGSLPEEIGMFIDLILEPVKHFSQGTCLTAVLRTVEELDLIKVLPLGRQHSLLNSVEVVMKKLGHLISQYLPEILQILLCMTALVSHILQQREKIQLRFINPLKNLRRLGISHVTEFFADFELYNFSAEEIDAVFSAVIWPQITRLASEGQYAPTALLKFIHVWSENARYFPLLAKQKPGFVEYDVLKNVFALLSAKNISQATANVVMDIVENLLSTPDLELTENVSSLSVTDCQLPELSNIPGESLTLGTKLILSHVPVILQYLSGIMGNAERMRKKKFRAQVSKDLSILSKISKFVQDKEQSSILIGLLLPYLYKGNLTQDTEIDILETVQNLFKYCLNPASFLKPLARLFSVIQNKLSRQTLCTVFETLSGLDSGLKYIADVVVKLNAFDRRHLDDINFDQRLSGFQTATAYIKGMKTLDLNYLITVMHNCFHSIELCEMSLSDSASLCLISIINQLASVSHTEEEFREVIQRTLLEAIRKGLRNKTESIQQDYTTLLSSLIRTFSEHSEFQDLVQLTDYNDPEMDYFENMKHIQIHRRARALKKLAKHLSEGKTVLSSRSLQNYIMPYATTTLFDEKMIKYENMTTASVEMVGAVCKHLSWSAYTYYLKHFLHVLQTGQINQKLAVSLLVTVLEAFHFDHETLRKELEAVQKEDAENAMDIDHLVGDEAMELEDSDNEREEKQKENMDSNVEISNGMAPALEMEEPSKEPVQAKAPIKSFSSLPRNQEELENLIQHIHKTLTGKILPKLHKCLTAKVKRDDEHKLVKSKVVNDEEVVRVPIAFAMIKLMQSLPKEVMEANLPSVLLKVCMLLRNRAQEIRDVARSTLTKIIETLGSQYLLYILKEMKAALVKGYQVHVLTFTVHLLLKSLSNVLKSGELEPCMNLLIEIFNHELFGEIAEEKEVKGIVSKVMEARSSKSYESYEILAQFVGKNRVTRLILPLKEILENTTSLKVSRKVHETLRRIVYGLLLNTDLSAESILLLSHGLINESLPLLTAKTKSKMSAQPPPDPRLPAKSCLLLSPTPTRDSRKAPVSSKTNMHILVDIGLKLLHMSLKKSKVNSSEEHVLEMLDPFIQLLIDCLQSMHVKVITGSLQSFLWLLKFPLPSVETNVEELTKQLFVLLKHYAKAGAARGENFHLVVNCFKVCLFFLFIKAFLFQLENKIVKVATEYS
uniref:UTP20 small subunit processome component n=1 Tax=Latimeria chalumnae TaxID=7897 RepID=H3APA8_LATCH